MNYTKNHWAMLERLYGAEIQGAMTGNAGIMQVRKPSKALLDLIEDGCAEEVELKLPGRFTMTITGYALTIRGNLVWCEHCADLPGEDQ